VKANENEIALILSSLKDCPVRIADASKGIALARLHARADKKIWSVNDILAHIRSSSDVWGGSI